MTASGYSAEDAKNSGIRISWPMPMKRSRSLTVAAIDIDMQANDAVPRASRTRAPTTPTTLQRNEIPATATTTSSTTAWISARVDAPPAKRAPRHSDAHEQHDRLDQRPRGRPRRLAEDQRRPWQRRRQQPLQLADVALPDHRQPEEDRHEHRRLRHHARREIGL